MSTSKFPELGFYTLAGHTKTPADMLDEVRYAESLGIGSAWISERFDVKEAGVLVGAAAAVTSDIYICTGATNINTRHPMAIAGLATTASRLSSGRFALGVARGIGVRFDCWGVPKATNRHIRDFTDMMRTLWKGERVMGYDGPLGNFPYLHISNWINEDIPLLFGGYGPKSLEFAGCAFDGVFLSTFFSDAAVEKAVALVRKGAEKAGKDPDSVKVWTIVATACEPDEEKWLRDIVARMATYLQAPDIGEMLVTINDWDMSVLEKFRANKVVASMLGGIDSVATLEQLQEIQTLIPPTWYPAAVGDTDSCAQRWLDQFKAGADGVIIHASTPQEFEPVLKAYEKIREAERFTGRTNRPC